MCTMPNVNNFHVSWILVFVYELTFPWSGNQKYCCIIYQEYICTLEYVYTTIITITATKYNVIPRKINFAMFISVLY